MSGRAWAISAGSRGPPGRGRLGSRSSRWGPARRRRFVHDPDDGRGDSADPPRHVRFEMTRVSCSRRRRGRRRRRARGHPRSPPGASHRALAARLALCRRRLTARVPEEGPAELRPWRVVQHDGRQARGPGVHPPRVHRQRLPRAPHAAYQPAGVPRGAARRRAAAGPGDLRLAARGGGPAHPPRGLAGCAGGRRGAPGSHARRRRRLGLRGAADLVAPALSALDRLSMDVVPGLHPASVRTS